MRSASIRKEIGVVRGTKRSVLIRAAEAIRKAFPARRSGVITLVVGRRQAFQRYCDDRGIIPFPTDPYGPRHVWTIYDAAGIGVHHIPVLNIVTVCGYEFAPVLSDETFCTLWDRCRRR